MVPSILLSGEDATTSPWVTLLLLVYLFYILAMLIPSIAVSVRRLHDIGKSGWMLLIYFIPLIGSIWLLILFLTDSEPGENKYGPNPKEERI